MLIESEAYAKMVQAHPLMEAEVAKTEQPEEFFTMLAPGTKKIAICQRRLGTRDRMVQIALCTNETAADHIVQGLHLRQNEIVKIETPMERELSILKEALAREKAHAVHLSGKLCDEQRTVGRLKEELQRAISERDAAQKAARETA